MLEMAATGQDGLYARGIAGDSFNTAVYLAREGLSVSYLTRLGDDSASDRILARLTTENIDTAAITRCRGRSPGLYLIDNDANGERQFSYWRDRAPARELFDTLPHRLNCDVFYFTGITLAVTRSGIGNLLRLLQQLRDQGTRIIFDPNYRPRLWQDVEQARFHYQQVIPLCDTVLPTLEDECALWGPRTADECLAFYQKQGVSEIVIKGDQLTTLACAGGERLSRQAEAVAAMDTTGAGDAYNAGYLAVRLTGGDLQDAISNAQKLSAAVVQHRGAILPRQ